MRPHDVLVLLKIVSFGADQWHQKPLAASIGISQSEVSKSINRSKYAGLLDPKGQTVMKTAFLEFLTYGLAYLFPQKLGPVVRGVPTSHSKSPLKELIQSNEDIVWPHGKGKVRGHGLLPLCHSIPMAALKDDKLHQMLALVDALRIGRTREKALAVAELKKSFGLEK